MSANAVPNWNFKVTLVAIPALESERATPFSPPVQVTSALAYCTTKTNTANTNIDVITTELFLLKYFLNLLIFFIN